MLGKTLNFFSHASKRFYVSNKKVALIGSGNWGTVVSKIVGGNLNKGIVGFDGEMMMYVRDEEVGGRSLCDIINQTHINQRYMKHCVIPPNVRASCDLEEVSSTADILILVFPHQFVDNVCDKLKACVKKGAKAVSLIKGFNLCKEGKLSLISDVIASQLHMPCPVIMGANIADEVAMEMYSEATLGCSDPEYGQLLKNLFETPYFRIAIVPDAKTVELCGALKNIVAVGAGFADGLGCGRNTNSAVIRLGLMEIITLVKHFHKDCQIGTFFESCGIGDLMTTAVAGRNHLVAMEFAKQSLQSPGRVSICELEERMLDGQKLQGPATAADVAVLLEDRGLEECFPLFTAIHQICTGRMRVEDFVNSLKHHPHHIKTTCFPSSSLSSSSL